MTVLMYIRESKIATTAEILALKREYPADWDMLVVWAIQEMTQNNIPIDAPAK